MNADQTSQARSILCFPCSDPRISASSAANSSLTYLTGAPPTTVTVALAVLVNGPVFVAV